MSSPIVFEQQPPSPPCCGVCREFVDYELNPIQGGCPNGHPFHTACIAKWVGTAGRRVSSLSSITCPVCRADLPEKRDLLKIDYTLELGKFEDYVARTTVENGFPTEEFADWVNRKSTRVYALGFFFENFLCRQNNYRQMLEVYPPYDANTLGLRFWRHSSGQRNAKMRLMLATFVAQNHACSWECEETPCFLKRHIYC